MIPHGFLFVITLRHNRAVYITVDGAAVYSVDTYIAAIEGIVKMLVVLVRVEIGVFVRLFIQRCPVGFPDLNQILFIPISRNADISNAQPRS